MDLVWLIYIDNKCKYIKQESDLDAKFSETVF